MKKILLLWLIATSAFAQGSVKLTFGTGSGGSSATLVVAPTINALRYTWPTDTIANPTLANVQAAINAAPTTGKHLVLARANITITADLAFNKKNIWLDGQGLCTWTRSNGSSMIAETGDISGSRISGMTLLNFSTTGSASVVASYEITKKDNYSFDHNTISCPYGDFNAYGMVQYSSGNVAGSLRSNNVNISDNITKGVGRMHYEILAQRAPAVGVLPYITNLTFARNYMEDGGRNNSNGHGMGVSLDGLIEGFDCDSNTVVEAKDKSIEVVNTRKGVVRRNTIINRVNLDVAGIAQSAGNSPKTYGLRVEFNNVTTTGSPFQYFDLQDLQMRGNTGLQTTTTNAQNSHGLNMVRVSSGTLINNTIRAAGYHGAMFNNSSNITATGNLFSNQYSATEYQAVYLYGAGSTGNDIRINKLVKKTGATNSNYINEESGAAGSIYTNNTTSNTP